jgi:hypothetical protein
LKPTEGSELHCALVRGVNVAQRTDLDG